MPVPTIDRNGVQVKLGRRPSLTRPRLALSAFLTTPAPATLRGATIVTPVTPSEVHRSDWKLPNPMLANGPDPTVSSSEIVAAHGVGCCVESAMLKGIMHMHYGAGQPIPEWTGEHALALYAAITGYDITQTAEDGSNPTDQGTDPNQAFTYWQQTGITLPDGTVHKIAGFLSVDPHKPREWETALYEFDCLFAGYNLPATIEGQPDEWTVTDPSLQGEAAPGSLGGHEILKVSYDQTRERNYSWTERPLTSRGFAVYCDQLTAVITTDQLSRTGVSETGLDWTALLAAAHRLAPVQ